MMRRTRPHLNSLCKTCLVVACALLFFSACEVTLINPLPDSLTTRRDERLLGRWVVLDEQKRPDYVRFDKGAGEEMIIRFETGDPNAVLRATTLKIDDASYLTLDDSETTKRNGYLLAKYVLTGDHLKVWLLDEKKVRQAIRDGKLKGEIGKEPYAGSAVTDTPEKILSYIKTAGDDAFELFGEGDRVTNK